LRREDVYPRPAKAMPINASEPGSGTTVRLMSVESNIDKAKL
jgi:hypothetical protein